MIKRSRAARSIRAIARTAILATVAIASAACGDVPSAFGPTPSQARANADGLFGAFVKRFTNVERTPRYARAREMLLHYALTPSQVYGDTSIWTSSGPDGYRTLFGNATFRNGRYIFSNTVTDDPVQELGEGRHIMRLHKISNDDYDWFTGVDFVAGTIKANDFANVITQWLAASEGHSGAELRTAYRSRFPRTTDALGQLYSLDTLISTRDADGANNLYAVVHITPDGIRKDYPAYADYMAKYADKVKLNFTLLDSRGTKWIEATSRNGYVTLHLRSRGGHFAPLDGPIRPMPDTLAMRVDFTAKIKLFTIGVEHMSGEWVNIHTDHDRGWALRFTREPGWVLPPVVGYLIKSPLRRPFEGNGTQFRFTIHDQPGGPTLMSRRGSTTVRESAILRFIGKLGGSAMGEFVSNAEDEENRFNVVLYSALKADVDSALR